MRLLRWVVLAFLALSAWGSETTETAPQSDLQEHPPSNSHNDSKSEKNTHARIDSHPLVKNSTVKTKATTPVSKKATKTTSSTTLVESNVTHTKPNVTLADSIANLTAPSVANVTLAASNTTLPVYNVSASSADWPCAASEVGLCESLAGNVPQGSALWFQMKARLGSDNALVDLIKTGPRIIWVSTDNGLSNSWQGAVAFFYIAMLTDSLFFMDMGNSSQWEWGYEPHAIDWRVTPTVREALSGIPTTTLLSNYDTHGDELKEHFERGKGGFRSLFKGQRVLHVIGNRVHWQALFKNAHHVAALAAYQVTSVHAFGCAVGFLARVRKDGCGDFERRAVALLRANDTVSVGVQVRHAWGGCAGLCLRATSAFRGGPWHRFASACGVAETTRRSLTPTPRWWSPSTPSRSFFSRPCGSVNCTCVSQRRIFGPCKVPHLHLHHHHTPSPHHLHNDYNRVPACSSAFSAGCKGVAVRDLLHIRLHAPA